MLFLSHCDLRKSTLLPLTSIDQSRVYKLISKLLANRIKRVLLKVIDKHQTSFLSDRSMMDSVLIANETGDFMKKENLKRVILKVDYEKNI